MTALQSHLASIGACSEACRWAKTRTAQQAWDETDRPDWLLWWSARVDVDLKIIVRITCAIARDALQFVKQGEMRPLKAVETAEAWCDGKATLAEVRQAAYAAADADAAAAAYAADAVAADSAADADAAADAADAAAYAADAAADAVAAADAADAADAAAAAAAAAYAADAAAAAAYAAAAAAAAAAAYAAAAAAAYAAGSIGDRSLIGARRKLAMREARAAKNQQYCDIIRARIAWADMEARIQEAHRV
jgi:hypothetical protein